MGDHAYWFKASVMIRKQELRSFMAKAKAPKKKRLLNPVPILVALASVQRRQEISLRLPPVRLLVLQSETVPKERTLPLGAICFRTSLLFVGVVALFALFSASCVCGDKRRASRSGAALNSPPVFSHVSYCLRKNLVVNPLRRVKRARNRMRAVESFNTLMSDLSPHRSRSGVTE